MRKKSHRQRFSRKRFSNIMIGDSLKSKLDLLKLVVAHQTSARWNVSYADVISFLIKELNSSLSYPVKKFSISFPIKKPQLSLSFPIKKTTIVLRSKVKSTIN